jgi:hypothetical protein
MKTSELSSLIIRKEKELENATEELRQLTSGQYEKHHAQKEILLDAKTIKISVLTEQLQKLQNELSILENYIKQK